MQLSLQRNNRVLFLTGSILITTIAMVLLITALSFFAGLTIAAWQFPTAVVLTGVLYYFICKNKFQNTSAFTKAAISSALIIIFSVIVAAYFYDVTYDGQSYHQEGIYQLAHGWNTFKTLLPKSVNMAIYINHYGKGVEIPQSTLYALTGRIEAGKATNFILLTATFCLTLSLLLGFNKLTTPRCILIAILATCNPIIINQLISTYVDGQLAMMVQCLFVIAIWLTFDSSIYNLLLMAAVVIIGANVKFTGLVYVVIFIAALLGWLLFTKNIGLFKQVIFTALASGVVAVLVVGFNPYVVNTVKFQHPFYPLMGKNKVDIVGYNLPPGFEKKGGMDKLFTSLLAHTDNQLSDRQKPITLKIPFTVNKTDFTNSFKPDTRIAGFGPFFSGILLLTLTLLIVVLLKPGKFAKIKNLVYLMGAIVVAVLIMPESWWARYIPQLWYLPIVVLMAAELCNTRQKILRGFLYLFIIFNVMLTFAGFGWNLMMTMLVNHQIAKLQASHRVITVQFGDEKAIRFRLEENHIPYKETILDSVPKVENFIRSDSKYIIPDNVANYPESNFLKWAEKFN